MNATPYTPETVTRTDVDRLDGATVVQFGTNWCGYCQRAEPLIDTGFEKHDTVRRIKVEDGSGLPLGRSFQVKLWPTLVFLRDGKEVTRVVRPTDADEVARALAQIAGPA
ncbi:MAG: thioredoxin family protein [Variovorax sp.]